MTKLTKKMKNDFDLFEVEIPILLEDIQHIMANSSHPVYIDLDFSDEEIDAVEEFYIRLLDGQITISCSHERFNRLIIAYYGECVIHHAGGKWVLCDVKNDPAFGTPVIIGWGDTDFDNVRVSPVIFRELFIVEKRKGAFKEDIKFRKNINKLIDDVLNRVLNPKNKKTKK